MNWFYSINKQTQGPITKAELESLIKENPEKFKDVLIWNESFGEKWIKAIDTQEFKEFFPKLPPPLPNQSLRALPPPTVNIGVSTTKKLYSYIIYVLGFVLIVSAIAIYYQSVQQEAKRKEYEKSIQREKEEAFQQELTRIKRQQQKTELCLSAKNNMNYYLQKVNESQGRINKIRKSFRLFRTPSEKADEISAAQIEYNEWSEKYNQSYNYYNSLGCSN
jgi:hypothetical protein